MIKSWRMAAIGLAFTAATFAGAAVPASAATVSQTSAATMAAGPTQVFFGFGGSPHLTSAIAQAGNDAKRQATAANARQCEFGSPEIDDTDPYFFVVVVELTCTG